MLLLVGCLVGDLDDARSLRYPVDIYLGANLYLKLRSLFYTEASPGQTDAGCTVRPAPDCWDYRGVPTALEGLGVSKLQCRLGENLESEFFFGFSGEKDRYNTQGKSFHSLIIE